MSTVSSLSKLYKALPEGYRLRLKFLLVLLSFSAFAEVISIAAVIPFLSYISTSNIEPISFEVIGFGQIYLPYFETRIENIIFSTALLTIMSIISTLVKLFSLWKLSTTSAFVGSYLSRTCFINTLRLPYVNYIRSSTSDYMALLTTQVNMTVGVINLSLQLITSVLVASSIVISLLILSFKISISAFLIFGSFYILIATSSKKRLSKNSRLTVRNNKLQIRTIQESFGSIKDIMLYGHYNYFTNEYSKYDFNMRASQANNLFLGTAPKYLLEAVGLCVIATIGCFLSFSPDSSSRTISSLGLLAVAVQKLLPSLQQIYSNWASIKGNHAALLNILSTLQLNEFTSSKYKKSDAKTKLQAKKYPDVKFSKLSLINVSFNYDIGLPNVLQNISIDLDIGDKVAITGPSGCGKSTLLDLILGFLEPTNGCILVNDSANDTKNFYANLQKYISYVPQDSYLLDRSIAENIALGYSLESIDSDHLMYIANICLVTDFTEKFPDGINTIVGDSGKALSGGQKQRISIARALFRNPVILILDESTSALDSKTEARLLHNLFEKLANLTIVNVTHRESHARYCSKVIELPSNKSIERLT